MKKPTYLFIVPDKSVLAIELTEELLLVPEFARTVRLTLGEIFLIG
ncbi:MAG: hypothetical protein AB4040_00110 [Synechococcus sp.]